MKVTAEQLVELVSLDSYMAGTWAAVLSATLHEYGLATPHRAAAFVAQTAYESLGYTHLEENLSHGAHRLGELYGDHFFTVPETPHGRQDASQFAGAPERVANIVYANRLGNGPSESGDGWKYRGRGLLRIAGRNHYHVVGRLLQLDLLSEPSLLTIPLYAAQSAAVLWNFLNCSALADEGSPDSFVKITELIGARPDRAARDAVWTKAKKLFGATGRLCVIG